MDSAAAVAAGGARTREPKNSVHVDNNWKQRIEAEEQTETHWKKNWGYLDSKANSDDPATQTTRALKHYSHAQLAEEAARLAPTYAFASTTKADRYDARSIDMPKSHAATAAASGTSRGAMWYDDNEGHRSHIRLNQLHNPNSAAATSASASASAQVQPLSSTRQWDRYWASDSAAVTASPHSAVRVGALDTALATSMQPRILQAVGANLVTPGVDPQRKYSYPLTASQEVGWAWGGRRSLELFGVSGHGKKNMKW